MSPVKARVKALGFIFNFVHQSFELRPSIKSALAYNRFKLRRYYMPSHSLYFILTQLILQATSYSKATPTLNIVLQSLRGRIIYENYKKNGVLDNGARNNLTTLIIETLYNNSIDKGIPFKLPRCKMESIVFEITKIFPTELEGLYFTPSINRRPTTGKLWKRFHNFKRKLKLSAEKT